MKTPSSRRRILRIGRDARNPLAHVYSRLLYRLALALFLALAVAACGAVVPPVDEPQPRPELRSCSLSNNEQELEEASWVELGLACLVAEHPLQGRSEMHYHPTLGELARARAQDMAERGYYGRDREYPPHVDLDGFGPNHYLCEAGYHDHYCHPDDPFANSVESIAMRARIMPPGTPAPHESMNDYTQTLEAWLSSPAHRRHLLAEDPYFAEGTHYGIGHAISEGEYEFVNEDGIVETWPKMTSLWVFIAAFPPDWDEE